MPCNDDINTGIPVASSTIQWTGGTLLNVPKPDTMCSVKLEYVVKGIDSVLKSQVDSFDMSKVNGTPFVLDASLMKFYDFANAIGAWANGIKNQIEGLQNLSQNVGQSEITMNLSCLVGENCAGSTYQLLNVLETMVARLCQHEADINRLKQINQTEFNTTQIYVPQT